MISEGIMMARRPDSPSVTKASSWQGGGVQRWEVDWLLSGASCHGARKSTCCHFCQTTCAGVFWKDIKFVKPFWPSEVVKLISFHSIRGVTAQKRKHVTWKRRIGSYWSVNLLISSATIWAWVASFSVPYFLTCVRNMEALCSCS